MTKEGKLKRVELTPIVVKSLKGSFHSPKNFDYKKELEKSLAKKYTSRTGRSD